MLQEQVTVIAVSACASGRDGSKNEIVCDVFLQMLLVRECSVKLLLPTTWAGYLFHCPQMRPISWRWLLAATLRLDSRKTKLLVAFLLKTITAWNHWKNWITALLHGFPHTILIIGTKIDASDRVHLRILSRSLCVTGLVFPFYGNSSKYQALILEHG